MVALKTFDNLEQARKEEIIRVCLKEFAVQDYRNASLSSIIEELQLAKGSFYRYFDSKQSLYFYLLEYCSAKRLAHDRVHIQEEAEDFFEMVLQHFYTKILFDKQHPLESAFIYNVLHEKNHEDIGDIFSISRGKILKYITPRVKEMVKQKVLRKDIPAETISFMVMQTLHSIIDHISIKYSIDHRKNIKAGKPLYSLSEKEMMKEAKDFVSILRNGILINEK